MKTLTLNTDAGTINIEENEDDIVIRGVPSYKNTPRVMKGDYFYHDAAAGVETFLRALVDEGVTDEDILENAVDTALQSLSNSPNE